MPRLLWTHTPDGQLSLWHDLLGTTGYTHTEFGPFAGWTVQSFALGTDNLPRLLWSHAPDGQLSLWHDLLGTGDFSHAEFGPFGGYQEVAFAVDAGNAPRVLWNYTGGSLSLWHGLAGSADFSHYEAGPFGPYRAALMAVGTVPHLLFTQSGGGVSLWNDLQGTSDYTHTEYAGPVGYVPVGMACGTGGDVRLLWSDGQGDAQVWTIGSSGTYTSVTYPIVPAVLASVSLSPASVTGGSGSTGKVTLSQAAPASGATVNLSSDNAAAGVPDNVTVPAGQTAASFAIGTTGINAATATITATAGITLTTKLTILPTLSLTAAATSANQVMLYWNGISGASGYNVYRSTTSGGPYTKTASNTSTVDTGPGMTNAFGSGLR